MSRDGLVPSCGQAVALTDASPLRVVVSGSPASCLVPGSGMVGASSRVLIVSGYPSPVLQRVALHVTFLSDVPDTCRYGLHTSVTQASYMSVTASKIPWGYPHFTNRVGHQIHKTRVGCIFLVKDSNSF